jgi:hypothetical protein
MTDRITITAADLARATARVRTARATARMTACANGCHALVDRAASAVLCLAPGERAPIGEDGRPVPHHYRKDALAARAKVARSIAGREVYAAQDAADVIAAITEARKK